MAVLIDPEKFRKETIHIAERYKPDFIFFGGSIVKKSEFISSIKFIKKNSSIPLVIFPGDENQISSSAKAILLLSLVSGRNPEFLIGKQVKSAIALKKSGLEIISTAYILMDEFRQSSVARVTHTRGISQKNTKEIVSTALAGEQLGFQCVYLEAGSGVKENVSGSIISKVANTVQIPLITGGGIVSTEKAVSCWDNGADLVVVGNAIEKNPELLSYFCEARNSYNKNKREK